MHALLPATGGCVGVSDKINIFLLVSDKVVYWFGYKCCAALKYIFISVLNYGTKILVLVLAVVLLENV